MEIISTTRGRATIKGLTSRPPPTIGVTYADEGGISFPLCPDIIRRLVNWGEEITIHPVVMENLRMQRQRRDGARRSLTEDVRNGYMPEGMWPYQITGANWLSFQRRGILADEQGMGKTIMALVAAERCMPYKRADTQILILCSNRKKQDWLEHINQWVPHRAAVIENDLEIEDWPEAEYLICNYTQAIHSVKALSRCHVLIADEAHIARNRKTQVFGALKKIAGKFKPVFLLTATPNLNRSYDIWALLHLCDPERFTSFWSFAHRFCSVVGNGFGVEVGDVREEEQERLDDLTRQYMLARHKNPSGISRRRVRYEMPEDQARLYTEMFNHQRIVRGGIEQVAAETKLAWITRLRQLAVHPGLVLEDYRGPSKVDALIPLLRERDTKAVVFVKQSRLAQLAQKRLTEEDISSVVLHGSQTPGKQQGVLEEFQTGAAQVLLCTHGTGGEGLNLVEADRVIFLELAWHPGGNQQAQNRIDRPGQTSDHIEAIVIHVPNTIEDYIWDIVKDKQKVTSEGVYERLRQRMGGDAA